MDEDQIMQQETQQGSSDGFLEGWEETGPGSEEPGLEENGEVQTGSSAESQDVESGGEQGTEAAASAKDVSGEREQYGEGSEESEPPAGKEPPPAPPPKTWTMDYMGQPVTISEADVPILAQKALDYDRIRASYDEARPVMDLFRGFAQRAGLSVQEYVGRLRTQAKQMEGMDERAAASAGSMKSAGQNHGPKDPFLEGWDE